MIRAMDLFFYGTHILFLGFVLFGWIVPRLRRLHLILLLLTAFSWFFLGIWFGIGYCFWTDWHWEIRRQIDPAPLPNSFLKLFLDSVLGKDLPETLIDQATAITYAILLLISIWVNIRPGLRFRLPQGPASEE